MSAVMKNSRFLHIPKTGGVWVERALVLAVKDVTPINVPHPHQGIDDCPGKDLKTFAFVRHPFSWYRSYWCYKMQVGFDMANAFDRDCMVDSFSGYVENIIEKRKGHYTKVCHRFLGEIGSEIDYIGKTENLCEDLIDILRKCDEDFDEDVIRGVKRANESSEELKRLAVCDEDLVKEVCSFESEIFERFYKMVL